MRQKNSIAPFDIGGQPPNPRGLSLWGFRKRVMLWGACANINKRDAHRITLSANLHVSAQVPPPRFPSL